MSDQAETGGTPAPPVLVAEDRSVRTITLNRPDRLNAVNDDMVRHLAAALEGTASSVRAVVLRGAGRAFCSGHDLKDHPPASSRVETGERIDRLQDLTRLIRGIPCPVITVVHGWAVGAGAELALASDLVMATRSARIRFPEVKVGLAITNGSSRFLSRALGPQRAKRIALMGDTIESELLYRVGLVSHLVDDADLDTAVADLAARVAALPEVSARVAKELLNFGGDGDLEGVLRSEVEASLRLQPEEFLGESGVTGA